MSRLFLNDTQVQSGSYTKATPNWTASSNFNIGAYEYVNLGGFNALDDIIDDFTGTFGSTEVIIPEPGTATFLLFGATGLLLLRRRARS